LGLGVRPGVDVAIGGVLRVVLGLVDAARALVAGGTALEVLGEVLGAASAVLGAAGSVASVAAPSWGSVGFQAIAVWHVWQIVPNCSWRWIFWLAFSSSSRWQLRHSLLVPSN
jgi:MFS family permease